MSRKSLEKQNREAVRRQRLVAQMLARQEATHLSCEEIAQRLAEPRTARGRIDRSRQSVAPNGSPWSKQTIARDIQEIKAHWQLEATTDAATWKSRFIAQYQHLLEIHWKNGAYQDVARTLAALRKIIGTDSDQVALYEQLQLQLSIAAQRLRAEFQGEPELAQRAFRALAGNPRANIFAVPDPPARPVKPEEKN